MPTRIRLKHLSLVGAALLMSCQPGSDLLRSVAQPREDVQLVADATTVESVVPRNATLESLLRAHQLPADLTTSVVTAVRGVFNPRELRADRSFWITKTLDGLFREFRYQIDGDNLLRVVFRNEAGHPAARLDVEVVTLPKEYQLDAVGVEISRETNSLIGAFDAKGENIQLPLQLADVFSGQLDFNSDLHLGDRMNVLFDRATRDGEFIGYGNLRAAQLQVSGRRISALYYVDSDGQGAWYDEEGRSQKRPFLKSPLPFNPRVTSGFTNNRFHPVLGINRPHLGVDFGAPFGTAVKAVAAGTITVAGWSGEAGRMVKIRHAGGYETAYLHLSAFGPGIRAGAHVEQDALIGRVGMTGTATGPHLDYRVIKNGVYLNPLTAFSKMPAGDPLSPGELPQFRQWRDQALAELTSRLGADAIPVASSARR